MAVRREQVILDLTDNLTPGLARAAVAAGLLDRELKSLGGTSVSSSKNLDRTSTSAERVGNSTRKSGPDIDKFSGRLRTLADAAVTLGPAVIPLAAGALPALTGALAGLGAAAGGIGVTVLAMHGLGDAIKAIDDYRLEPTAENLQKLRIEQEKLGPAGAEFSRYVANLEPKLRALQNTARAGLFPGLEDGIDAILTRAPEVEKIVNRLSKGMGDISRSAGESLAGGDFDAFFKYIETDARPTLEAFAHSAGNVALGVANMLVAFAPLSRDFTGGLEDATKAFADWSKGLDENQSFQEFLDYVRESGPQVIDFLGALVSAFVGLVQAAAPYGQVVLPVLTQLARLFATISGSPIGPGLYAAAAGMVAFNRASVIAEKSSTRFVTAWEGMSRARLASGAIGGLALLATSLTDVDDKAGLANTTLGASAGLMAGGPWGLAIGAAIGQVLDFKSAYDQANDSITAADDALRNNDTNAMLKEQADLVAQLAKEHPENGTLGNYFDAVTGSFHDFTGQTQEFKDRLAEIKTALANGGDAGDLFGETIGFTGNQMRAAAASAVQLEGALARLSGWFDRRDAVRAYKDSIDELKKSMKDGFTRADAANLDNIGRSILQVAQGIKNPTVRGNFLADARAQLEDMANHAAPKAKAAIQEIIDKFDDKGLTHPVIKPTVDDSRAKTDTDDLTKHVKHSFDIMNGLAAKPTVGANDDPFRQTFGTVKAAMAQADRLRAKPKVDVDPGNSLGILGQVANLLGNLHDRTIHVNVLRPGTSVVEPHASIPSKQSADGGTVPRSGMGYADRHPYMLADGEEVISNRHGQADRHRSLLKAINAGRLADGGTAASTHTSRTPSGPYFNIGGGAFFDLGGAANAAASGLKGLKKQLDQTQKAFDKAKQTRDAAVSRRDSLSGTIQQNLMGDSIWAASSGSVWAAGAHGANTPQGAIAALNERRDRAQRFVAALNTLKGKGVTGAALQEILSEGLEATEAMAAADLGTLSQFATAVNQSSAALAAAGLAGGNAVEGQNVAQANKRLDRLHDDLQDVKQAINDANSDNKQAHKDSGANFASAVNGGVSNGHRRGK